MWVDAAYDVNPVMKSQTGSYVNGNRRDSWKMQQAEAERENLYRGIACWGQRLLTLQHLVTVFNA